MWKDKVTPVPDMTRRGDPAYCSIFSRLLKLVEKLLDIRFEKASLSVPVNDFEAKPRFNGPT